MLKNIGGTILLPSSNPWFQLFGQAGPSPQNCVVMEYKTQLLKNI